MGYAIRNSGTGRRITLNLEQELRQFCVDKKVGIFETSVSIGFITDAKKINMSNESFPFLKYIVRTMTPVRLC